MLSSLLCFLFFSLSFPAPAAETYVVGSKKFTENYLLAEIFSQLLEEKGYTVSRKFGMGGTMVAFNALRSGEIDLYPEYTGTISQAVLKTPTNSVQGINQLLSPMGLKCLEPLGFDNSYGIVMRKSQALELSISTISDLAGHSQLVGALSFEFQERKDGLPNLRKTYSLKNKVRGIEVPLTYEALKNKEVDFAEAYTTEPLIDQYDLLLLEDNKDFFPSYQAVALTRTHLPNKITELLESLNNLIDNKKMRGLNLQVVQGQRIADVANQFLFESGFIQKRTSFSSGIQWKKLLTRTQTHLVLTLVAVLLATLISVPLGTLASTRPTLGKYLISMTGVLQTIPSIALLTFMIPFFGIGFTPAIIGLLIYSLLPILQNTYTAMTSLDPRLLTSARGIGLYPREIFFTIKLPLALPAILAGIRTATTLSIGTATLAAFIGAGGLGEPIVIGLALNDTSQVLQGAVPAALLAILIDRLFNLIEKSLARKI